MTNTIPNVPLELKPCPFCGSEAGRATKKATWNLSRHRVACTNSGCGAHYGYWHPIEWNTRAPSPAGVDEDDEYMPDGIVQGIMQSEEVDAVSLAAKSLKAAGVDGWDVAGDILEKLSAAQAIIDGLRGENERIRLNIAEYNEAISCYQSERDQQAQRIGELEGLLRESGKTIHKLQAEQPTPARIARYLDAMRGQIDAALSAGKEGE